MKRTIMKTLDRKRVSFKTTGESLTHQSFKEECDINRIMKKWEKTGVLEHRNTFEGSYSDFTNVPMDYHESMNSVIAANAMFETLPAKVRKRFQNDPGEFLDFVSDPDNKEEMKKLGLLVEPQSEPYSDVIEKPGGDTKKDDKGAQKPAPEPKTGEKKD